MRDKEMAIPHVMYERDRAPVGSELGRVHRLSKSTLVCAPEILYTSFHLYILSEM